MSARSLLVLVAMLSAPSLGGCALERAGIGGGSDGGAFSILDARILDDGGSPADGGPPADAGVPVDAGPHDAATPDSGSGADAGPRCTSAENACSDDVATICDDATGTLSTIPCELGCNAAETACARVLPSNVDAALFDGDAAAWAVPTNATYDTSACTGGTVAPQLATGPEVCVRRVASLSVASGARLRVTGARPLVVLAQGAVVIDGTLDVSAVGATAGPGGGAAGVRGSPDGQGARAGTRGGIAGTYGDGGGGGGGFCGTGGGGGDGSGSAAGGDGGSEVDAAYALSPLQGGSGGGWARGAQGSEYDNGAAGGAGGGVVQITSRASITVTGAILAGGGGGAGGGAITTFSVNFGAGGGGGSGGGILLEAPTLTFGASARVWTTGGGGGGAADGEDAVGSVDVARPGGPGQDGREIGARSAGGASGGSAFGAAGGRGGGGGTDDGEDGQTNVSRTGSNGGGGGGGVGCIVLRSAAGSRPGDRTPFSGDTNAALRAFDVLTD